MRYFLIAAGMILFAPVLAKAQDICRKLAESPETEQAFAKAASTLTLKPGEPGYPAMLEIYPNGGSCYSDGVRRKEGDAWTEIVLNCEANGCGFGETFTMLHFGDQVYLVGKEVFSNPYHDLPGWQRLPEQEKDILEYRRMTHSIYRLDSDSAASEECRVKQGTRQERLIAGKKACNGLGKSTKSIFPASAVIYRSTAEGVTLLNPPPNNLLQSFAIKLGEALERDLDGDGVKERFVLGTGESGAGCGCDMTNIALLDASGEVPRMPTSFAKKFKPIAKDLKCGENLDIVMAGKDYYLQKTSVRGFRMLYPLKGPGAFLPACIFFDESQPEYRPVGKMEN